MAGISPKLPLSIGKPEITYVSNKTLKESIHQNLKNLILNPIKIEIFLSELYFSLRKLYFI